MKKLNWRKLKEMKRTLLLLFGLYNMKQSYQIDQSFFDIDQLIYPMFVRWLKGRFSTIDFR